MSNIVVVCECCGLQGKLVGAGSAVRGRCLWHEHVADPGDWLRARSEMTCAFESEEELMSYFLSDYGAGVDVMQEMTRDVDDTRRWIRGRRRLGGYRAQHHSCR